jgi:integrin beta 3
MPPPGIGGSGPGMAVPPPGPGFGLPGPLPPVGPDLVTTGMIRRAELRKQLKIQQQLKGITLVLVVLLLLAAYPVYLFARSLAADPVLSGLDGLGLPEWAAYEHEDAWDGSRWCIGECRIRQRTWLSERAPDETHLTYANALLADGWRARQDGCPQSPDETSVVTCWAKDEYVMVLHVRPPLLCVVPPSREPVPGATPTADPGPDSRACPGSLATLKVSYAIDPALQI